MAADARLVVVGGGIVGAFVAYLAARRPGLQTIVLDRAEPGRGASAFSAGVSFPIVPTESHRHLAALSRARYLQLMASAHGRWIRQIAVVYAVPPGRLQSFAATVAEPLAEPLVPLRDRVLAMLPDLELDGDQLVTHAEAGLVTDAGGLCGSLLAEAAANGAEVVAGRSARDIGYAGGRFVVRCEDLSVIADLVVLATGPWPHPRLTGDVNLSAGQVGVKKVAALYARPPVEPSDPLVYFVHDDVFVLPTGRRHALVSFRSERWGVTPESLDGSASETDVADGKRALARRSPAAAATVYGGRAFCDLYMPDRLPQVRTDPEMPGIAAVVGGSGSGVRLAPGLASEALAAVLG
jgi:D-arginine dehydrogenase